MRLNLLIRTVTVLSLAFTALACRAETIYGLPITAILSTTDPNTTILGSLNPSPTQIIEPGVEFRFEEIYSMLNQRYPVFEESFWTVDFGPDSVSVTIQGNGGPDTLLTLSGLPPSFGNLQTPYPTNCTLSAFLCNYYAPLATFSGSTLSLDFPGLLPTETDTFTPLSGSSAVPEPASLVLLATGALGLAAVLRRRIFAQASRAGGPLSSTHGLQI